MAAAKETTEAEPKFSKDQLLGAKKYADRRDLLNVLLDGSAQYTIAEVDKAIDNFMKAEFDKAKEVK